RTVGGCSTGADGDTVVFHGWLALTLDAGTLAQALRWPALAADERREFAAARTISLADALRRRPDSRRIKANIAEAFESACDVELSEGDLTLSEEARYRAALPEIAAPAWTDLVTRPRSETPQLEATEMLACGALSAIAIVDSVRQTLQRLWLGAAGAPDARRALLDLEAELRDVAIAKVPRRVEWFFASRSVPSGIR